MFYYIFRFYLKICALVGFIFLTGCIIGIVYLLWFDPDFFDIDSCLDQGLVWDYEQRICRDDCLTWNKREGCVPITDENIEKETPEMKYFPETYKTYLKNR